MSNKFKVIPLGLNLRSKPVVKSETRIAVLPQGHIVTKINVAETNNKWWFVNTTLQGVDLEGFVAHRHLASISDFVELPEENKIVSVHMRENKPNVSRNYDDDRAYPLGEPNRPARKGNSSSQKVAELTKIVDWLSVDKSIRYKKKSSATYCNIYAYDYCYLAGVYLPRVWWNSNAIAKLANGKTVIPQYGVTIRELNANSLYDWLEEFSDKFGWQRVFDVTEIQSYANNGEVALICAQRKNLNYSGHICAVVPETSNYKAEWNSGKVIKPLQSQAGAINFRYSANGKWWTNSKFSNFGLWRHP